MVWPLDMPEAQATYDRLFPYYVEVSAVTQLRPRGERGGGPGGHATMFIGGAARDSSAGYPRLKLADENAPGDGIGVSVNRAFANANWIAVAGREMFFHGGMRDDETLDRRRFDAAVKQAAQAGWFEGIELTPAAATSPRVADVEAVVRHSIGTDFALTFGRTVYAARLPMPQPALAKVIDYLNDLNDRAARRGYEWNALTNNCSHVIHNALAAAGVWDPKTVRAGTTVDTILDLLSVATAVVRRRMSDFSFPANNFVRVFEAANERPIDDAAHAWRDHDIRRSIDAGWLVTGPGGLVRRYPMHDASRNDLFAQGRDPVLASVPLLWDKRRTFVGLTRATPAHLSDLVANLTHFRERFTRALAGERLQGEANFAMRYERVIASELERTERAIASIANDAASTASLSATPAAVTSPRAPS